MPSSYTCLLIEVKCWPINTFHLNIFSINCLDALYWTASTSCVCRKHSRKINTFWQCNTGLFEFYLLGLSKIFKKPDVPPVSIYKRFHFSWYSSKSNRNREAGRVSVAGPDGDLWTMACRFRIENFLLMLYLSGATAHYLRKVKRCFEFGFLASCQEQKCPRSIVEFASCCTEPCNAMLSPSEFAGGSCLSCQCPLFQESAPFFSNPMNVSPITSMYVSTMGTPLTSELCACSWVWVCILRLIYVCSIWISLNISFV